MKRQYTTHRDFFHSRGDYHVEVHGSGFQDSISIEELYQHFKNRLVEDLKDAERDKLTRR